MDGNQSYFLKDVCWTRGQNRETNQIMCDGVNKRSQNV